MALQLGNALSAVVDVDPLPLSTVEGGTRLNFTIRLEHNRTEDVFNHNSTACRDLRNHTVFVNLLISLPIVFDIVRPKNDSIYNASILTNLSNCTSVISFLDINSSRLAPRDSFGFNVLKFELLSLNVSWTAILDVELMLQHSVRPDSLLNITANMTFLDETEQLHIASYTTPIPGSLHLLIDRTSILETPGIVLTTEEEITFHATFQLPRITADLKLELVLPTFQNSTPMRFLSASVLGVSSGIMAEKLAVGSTPQVRIGVPNLDKFPQSPNIAEFVFGETVNKANASFNGTITVGITGIVDSLQGVYVPDTKGNITSVLKYKSVEGFMTAEQTSLMVELGQPLLEHHLAIYGPVCCYEGNDIVQFGFEISNPEFSTAPALNLSATIGIVPPDLEIQSISVELCSNISVSNHTGNQSSLLHEVNCTNLVGSSSLVNYSSSFEISSSRLNSSSWIHGNLTALVKPSVAAYSLHPTDLTLVYTRESWGYVSRTDTQTIQIEPVTTHGPFVINTSVPHPLRDQESITIGEDIVFQLGLSLPESTNDDFFIVVRGDGLEGVEGNVISVGGNIKSLDRNFGPTALNVTSGVIPGIPVSLSSPALTGSLGTVVNTGNLSQSSANEIVYDATIRCENRSFNVRGYQLIVDFAVYINGEPQPIRSHFLTVVEPHLTVQLTPSQTAGVQPESELHFTVRLHHSGLSTTHAYRILLEIAVPHEYMTGVQQTVPPGGGTLSVVSGDQAPSGNPRYNNPSTRVLVYQVNELLLGQSVSFQYKARTVSNLQPSLYISSPVHVSYTSLPVSQAPRVGREYKADSGEGTFLTFRPPSFIEVVFSSPNGSFDGGDRVEYKLTLNNVAADSSTQAYEISVDVTFRAVDTNQMYINCDRGSQTFNATTGVSVLSIASLAKSQTVLCNYTSFIQSHVSPREVISQQASVRYYNRPLSGSPVNYASYMERRTANITIEPINATFIASANAEELMAGDPVNFTLHLQLPECVTNLWVVFNLPTVSRDVIALSRRRRDEEILKRNDRDRRSLGVVYALEPMLSDSYVTYGDGVTIPNITQVNQASLEIEFGVVQNLPGSGSNGSIVIFLKFKTADEPLVLSGRPLALSAILNFDAGSDVAIKRFIVVGPLVKPLLIISKSAKQLDTGQDSPPVMFNVTVSHANNSMYDALNVTVVDSAEGMDYYNPSGLSADEEFVTSPRKNTFVIHFSVPSLRIGESKTFLYRGQFKVNVKEPVTIRNPAETTWKSVQLNSPIYRLLSSRDSGCVTRDDVNDPRTRKVFGFFALGIILGLLLGAVIAGILVLVIVKCCDKGKMASYYMRFTNTSTMTVLTGGSEYIYHERDLPDNKPVEKHTESCIVQTDESIVPILTLDSATQTEKELNSLDVQATAVLDADLESQRQSMFMKALSLLARKLRVKREISSDQENHFVTELKQVIGAVARKMAAEYKKRSAELRRKLQRDGKSQLDALHVQQRKEREETANKIKGLVSEREKKDILDLLKRRHDSQEEELKRNLKLQQDVEMEKLRKEISISKRFAMKESQNKVLQDLIKDAKLKEELANAIMREHLANMAAIDKATDEERARRVMALEIRLAERRALARQKQDEEERKKKDMEKLGENRAERLENLVSSSKLNAEDAAVYLERFRKEREAIDIKLAKERKKQEQKLHQKLTALKQQRIEEKAREHHQQLRELDEQQTEKFEEVEIDTVAAINEKQRLLQIQRQEIEEIERFSDEEAAAEIEKLRDQQQREANQLVKNNTHKAYQELVSKGLSDSEKEAILERLTADLARQQEVRDEERRRQKEMIEKRLEKQRAALEKKMKQEQAEQAEVRKQEEKIVGDLIVNQVSMSEEERDRIMQEHEKNLAELESSLTLNKLRQRQKLEERLSERRKKRMEELEQKQWNEEKDRDYSDRILVEGEDIEMIKKHEQEKILAMKDDETRLEDEMETVREEMLAERSKKLEEHHEKLGAIIAQLQIEKAKQVSKIAMQQHALSQLQEGLVEELDSKGTFQDPETVKIMEKYQKETKKLEENLKNQKEKQEQALKDRLQERMKQREETLILKQKDEMSQYVANLNVNNTAMKLRKAAVKARHQKELNDFRNRMQKEIDQSINELKMTSDIRRLQAIEEQNIKLISIFVQQGKLKEGELESVLQYLFPGKSSNELDDLLSRIYGPNHTKSSGQSASDPRRPSTLEDRIRRASFAPHSPPIEKHNKKRKKSKRNDDEKRDLPPVNLKGSRKGLSLKESLHGYSTLTDADENSPRASKRSTEEIRSLPNVSRRQSYQPLKEGDDQEIVDEMFGDSPEKVRTKSGKRHRSRRSRDDENPTA